MIEQTSKTPSTTLPPFAYSVKAGVVSRILQVSPVFVEYPILTRHVFTAAQLAEMEVQS